MKIVHTSDWHIGKFLNDYSLLDDQRFWFDSFLAELSRLQPDALLISGDLYDRSVPSAEAVSLANKVLSKIVVDLKIKTFLISGNHDSSERLSFAGEMLSQAGLYVSRALSATMQKIEFEQADFYLLPYFNFSEVKHLFPEQEIKTQQDAVQAFLSPAIENMNREKINILLCHGTFSHGWSQDSEQVGGSELVDSNVFEDFDYVAMGHLHSFIRLSDGKMVYPSSPLKYSIDEASQKKGFVEADITKEARLLRFHEIASLRDVRILRTSFEAALLTPSDDYVFFELTDAQPVINGFMRLKALYPFALGLKYINIEGHSVSSDKLKNIKEKSPNEIFEDFFSAVTEKELTESQKAVIAATFKKITEA